jgi:putative transcriptional regulator
VRFDRDPAKDESSRQQLGFDFAALPPFRAVPNVRVIRARLGMTQDVFAKAIGVPLAKVRNWEQSRTSMDPAVQSLLRVVGREPDAASRALAG